MAVGEMEAAEVRNSIRGNKIQVAAGVFGVPPYDDNTVLQLPVNTQGRLSTAEEFEDIIIKRDSKGVITRLKDVARAELDAQTYSLRSMLNNEPAVAIPIFATPDANALDISDNVRKTMAELKKSFPEDMDYSIVYDPTVFVRHSIDAVIHTFIEAILLVVLVVIVFLQTWRALSLIQISEPTRPY